MSKPRAFVLHRLPPSVEAELDRSFVVERPTSDSGISTEALVAAARRSDAIVPTVTDPVRAAVFEAGRGRLKIVANFGVGVDLIDLGAAKAAGVIVTNTPGVLTDATADLTIGLMIMALRRLAEGERLIRSGQWTGWRPTHMLGRQVTGLTLGIVGYGRIGQAVAARARHGFGMRVLYTRRRADGVGPDWAERVSLERLVSESDVISLHCPLTAETAGLINRQLLARFKAGSVLLNTARGGLIDEPALLEALERGQLAGVGLDVYPDEPRVSDRWLARDDVVLLPHLGSATEETRTAMGLRMVENLRTYFAGRDPPNRVA